MACETFLKICQRCKQQFVKHQPQEQSPFIDQLLIGSSTVADIGSTIADLEAHQAPAPPSPAPTRPVRGRGRLVMAGAPVCVCEMRPLLKGPQGLCPPARPP